jgi:hypothetical protein
VGKWFARRHFATRSPLAAVARNTFPRRLQTNFESFRNKCCISRDCRLTGYFIINMWKCYFFPSFWIALYIVVNNRSYFVSIHFKINEGQNHCVLPAERQFSSIALCFVTLPSILRCSRGTRLPAMHYYIRRSIPVWTVVFWVVTLCSLAGDTNFFEGDIFPLRYVSNNPQDYMESKVKRLQLTFSALWEHQI